MKTDLNSRNAERTISKMLPISARRVVGEVEGVAGAEAFFYDQGRVIGVVVEHSSFPTQLRGRLGRITRLGGDVCAELRRS